MKRKELKVKSVFDNKGITLIALVITIIVLIILTSVSINMTLGENGIITKAKEAKKQIKIAQITDMLKLKKVDTALLDKNKGNVPIDDYIQEIQNDENMLYKVTRSRKSCRRSIYNNRR